MNVMVRLTLFGVIGILCIGLLWVQVHHLESKTYSSDEATSIIASKGVVQHGVPRLPSGQIYWRSPVSHYANGMSILALGPTVLGYSGISLLAYFLLLLLPAFVLLKKNMIFSGFCWPILMGLNIEIQQLSSSPRMYMLYTFWVAMVFWVLYFNQNIRWNRWGVIYVAFSILAALSHQHFIIFCPGLFLWGVIIYYSQRQKYSLTDFMRSPLLLAPFCGGLFSLAIHFGENYLPNAFENFASTSVHLGNQMSAIYPVMVLNETSFVPLWILFIMGVFLKKFRLSPRVNGLLLGFLVSYFGLALTLPHLVPYYIAPLIPLIVMASLGPWNEIKYSKKISKFNIGFGLVLMVLFVGVQFFTPNQALSFKTNYLRAVNFTYRSENLNYKMQWAKLREWVNLKNAYIISSEPEIVYLNIGRIHQETRSYGVPFETPCDDVRDDQFGNMYIYSVCSLEKSLAMNRDRPVLFIGSRLSAPMLNTSLAKAIESRFLNIDRIRGSYILCYHPDVEMCKPLKEALVVR
jgi:hypothetical protein